MKDESSAQFLSAGMFSHFFQNRSGTNQAVPDELRCPVCSQVVANLGTHLDWFHNSYVSTPAIVSDSLIIPNGNANDNASDTMTTSTPNRTLPAGGTWSPPPPEPRKGFTRQVNG